MELGMIGDACGMAKASLYLLHLSSFLEQPETLKIASAVLAAQVCDWHYRPIDPGHAEKEQFGIKYPDWKALLAVANGTKHPSSNYPQIALAEIREPEWEDKDYYYSNLDVKSVFIEINGQIRSLFALIFTFCTEYIEQNS